MGKLKVDFESFGTPEEIQQNFARLPEGKGREMCERFIWGNKNAGRFMEEMSSISPILLGAIEGGDLDEGVVEVIEEQERVLPNHGLDIFWKTVQAALQSPDPVESLNQLKGLCSSSEYKSTRAILSALAQTASLLQKEVGGSVMEILED